MYCYEWDSTTGGILLNTTHQVFSKEPRPVYYKELDILGFDKYWNYDKNDTYPYMWAEANNYFYRGEQVAKIKGGSIYTAPEIEIMKDPEPDGSPLRFVDIPAMVKKNKDIMESLEQETIKKIYNTYIEHKNRVDVFYVAFSGGKDSVVALDLVQRALPHNEFKVMFGDTGMEFPDTYDVVDEIKNDCLDKEIDFLSCSCDLSPEYTWKEFGPPAQTIRWCCSVHKSAPQILFLRKYLNNVSFRGMAFTGIRGDESASRSEYDDVGLGEKIKGQYSCHPILHWNSAELFIYIYKQNLIFNEAYKKGNSRAGCLVCPLASYRNMFIKEQCYSEAMCNYKHSTTLFNDLILETTSKELNSEESIQEFMDIAGWKARRSGRELNFAKNYIEEKSENGVFTAKIYRQRTDWKEWLKTVGDVTHLHNGDIEVLFLGKPYVIKSSNEKNYLGIKVNIGTNTKNDILFVSVLKGVLRKCAYCIKCKVCEANCPHGYITMNEEGIKIDDKCVKCRKCHDVYRGCLVENSLRMPKGDKKMGSIDRYGNMGIEYSWVVDYFEKKDGFWESAHGLGTNKIKYLKSFLNDSGVTKNSMFTLFGDTVDRIGIDTEEAWALMICNLAYTAEFNWWIKNIDSYVTYTPDMIYALLDDSMSKNSRDHIVSAYKNIFISNEFLSNKIGLGNCDYELRNDKRYLNNIIRTGWNTPSPKVILYSLYKFAEACKDYYQFSLSRLLDHEIDSDGISPTQIFGIGREDMERMLNGLSIKYPEFISAKFTLGLDNITLNSEKTSADVLELF